MHLREILLAQILVEELIKLMIRFFDHYASHIGHKSIAGT